MVRCSLLWTPIVLEDPGADSDESEYDWRADQGDQGGDGGEGGLEPSDPRAGGRAPNPAGGRTAEASPVDRQPVSAANPEGATGYCRPSLNTSKTQSAPCDRRRQYERETSRHCQLSGPEIRCDAQLSLCLSSAAGADRMSRFGAQVARHPATLTTRTVPPKI